MTTELTVLMPVYNGEMHVEQAARSILSQTYGDFEFLIINDGSTDNTQCILERLASQDERIRLISRENRGLIATLNEGVELTKTPLIARMDADDIAIPHRFARQLAFLKRHPSVALLGSAVHRFSRMDGPMVYSPNPCTHEKIRRKLNVACSFWHPTVVMKRDAVIDVGHYDPLYLHAEDFELWVRMARSGYRMANLAEPLLFYRLHTEQVSFQNAEIQQLVTTAICHYSRTGVRSAKPITNQWLASEGVAVTSRDVLMAKQLMRRVDALIHNNDTFSIQKIVLWHEERGRKEGLSKEMKSAINYAKGRLSFHEQRYLGGFSNLGHAFGGSPYMNLKWHAQRLRVGVESRARFVRRVPREAGGLVPAIRSWCARP